MSDTDKIHDEIDPLDDMLDDEALLDEELDNLDDDFEDDDWDMLDEDGPDDSASADMPPAAVAKTEKSFLAKHFNLIVIAIAVVFGGLFILNTLSGSKNQAPQTTAPEAVAQPEPVQSPQPDIASNAAPENAVPTPEVEPINLDFNNLRNLQEDKPIVPPYEEEIAAFEQKNAKKNMPEFSGEASTSSAMSVDGEDDLFADLLDAPEDEIKITKLDKQVLLPMPDTHADSGEPPFVENMGAPSIEPAIEDTMTSDMKASPLPDMVTQDFAADLEAANTATLSPAGEARVVELQEKVIDLQARLDALAEENLTLEQDLSKTELQKQKLELNLSEVEQKYSSLDQAHKELKKIAEQQKEAAAKVAAKAHAPATETKKVEKKAPVKSMKSAVSAPKSSPAAVTPRPVVKVAAPKWTMRSAQPGRAVLSNPETGDLLRITEGDTVQGLGTIRSIRYEQDKWIIEGSKASITR